MVQFGDHRVNLRQFVSLPERHYPAPWLHNSFKYKTLATHKKIGPKMAYTGKTSIGGGPASFLGWEVDRQSGKGTHMAESLVKYMKDDVLIGENGAKVAQADSQYPEWAYDDQIFLATLEDAQRTAATSN